MHLRTYLLAGGAFAVGTSAYVVSGVLPAVSAELGVSLTAAGQLATAFALGAAVGAPLLASLTSRWERRTLLLVALLVAAAGNALSAVTTDYPWDGNIVVDFTEVSGKPWALTFRIPAWCTGARATVNGVSVRAASIDPNSVWRR